MFGVANSDRIFLSRNHRTNRADSMEVTVLAEDHPLHKLIGDIVSGLDAPNTKVVLDKACGGEQKIQLFCTDASSYKSCLCHVDAAILFNDQVKVIIEVEESDIRPVHLCGKVFVSALATHYIHRKKPYRMADTVFFVQVIDTSDKPDNASKLPQCRYLETSIQNLLCVSNTPLQWDIFYGGASRFQRSEDQQELMSHIRHAIAN